MGYTIKNNLDLLLLDSIYEAKESLDWKRIQTYSENLEKNIIKKKHFKTFPSNTKLSTKSRIGFDNFELEKVTNRLDIFNLMLENLEFQSNLNKNITKIDLNGIFDSIPKNNSRLNFNDFPVIVIGSENTKNNSDINSDVILGCIVGNIKLKTKNYKNKNLEDFIDSKVGKLLIKKHLNKEYLYLKIKDSDFEINDNLFSFLGKKINISEFGKMGIFCINLSNGDVNQLQNTITLGTVSNGEYIHFDYENINLKKSKSPYYFESGSKIKQKKQNPASVISGNLETVKIKNIKFNPIKIGNSVKNKLLLKKEVDSLFSAYKSVFGNENKLKSFYVFYTDLDNLKKIDNEKITFNTTHIDMQSSFSSDSVELIQNKSDLSIENLDKFGLKTITVGNNWFPYLHITNDSLEIPSISINNYLGLGGEMVTDNTKRVLIFNSTGTLQLTIDKINNKIEAVGSSNNKLLPRIFESGEFVDSRLDIEDEFFDYYSKLRSYYKLKNKFKNTYIYDFNNLTKLRKNKNINNIKIIKNKIPLFFENDKFIEKLSNIIPNSDMSSKFDNYLGLWPHTVIRPLPLPKIPENQSVDMLLARRKNRSHNKVKSQSFVLRGLRYLLNDDFNAKLRPGIYFNDKLDGLKKNDQTIRILPEVNWDMGFKKFPNLREYYITPHNLTLQFWDEKNIANKFQITPTLSYKSRNGFIFKDRQAIDTILKPILSGTDNSDSNYNNTKHYWWDAQNKYFEDYDEIQKQPLDNLFWMQQILPEYWNLMVKRESRSIINKIHNTADSFFKYDWMRGVLYKSMLSVLNEDVIFNNLVGGAGSLFEKNKKYYKVISDSIEIKHDSHSFGVDRESSYGDMDSTVLSYYDNDIEVRDLSAMANHDIMHVNYDDLLFDTFKWMDGEVQNDSWPKRRQLGMSNSYEFGDEVPEIQLKFRESVDFGHNVDRISRYILGVDNIKMRDFWLDRRFTLEQSTDKFRKYKETFKFELEDDLVRGWNNIYNDNNLSDLNKTNDKNAYFLESMFGTSKDGNLDYKKHKSDNLGIKSKVNKGFSYATDLKENGWHESKYLLSMLKKNTIGGVGNAFIEKIILGNGIGLNNKIDRFDINRQVRENVESFGGARINNNEFYDILEGAVGAQFSTSDNNYESNFTDMSDFSNFGNLAKGVRLNNGPDFSDMSIDFDLQDRFSEYEKTSPDYWFLQTIENSSDLDTESINLSAQNLYSNQDIFENTEIGDQFVNVSEDGSEYGESPTSSYAIADHIVDSADWLRKETIIDRQNRRVGQRGWSRVSEEGDVREELSNDMPSYGYDMFPRSELDLKPDSFVYKNKNLNKMLNYAYLSNGIYNFENYNKKNIVNGDIIRNTKLEKLNVLGNKNHFKHENFVQNYNQGGISNNLQNLFTWNVSKRGGNIDYLKIKKLHTAINLFGSGGAFIPNYRIRRGADLYINEVFDYTPVLDNTTLSNKVNKKDFGLDSELSDRLHYALSSKRLGGENSDSDSFENYSESSERFKIENKNKNSTNTGFMLFNNSTLPNSLSTLETAHIKNNFKLEEFENVDYLDTFYNFNKRTFNKNIKNLWELDQPNKVGELSNTYYDKKYNFKELSSIDLLAPHESTLVPKIETNKIQNMYDPKTFRISQNLEQVLNLGDKEVSYFSDEVGNSKIEQNDISAVTDLNNSDWYKKNETNGLLNGDVGDLNYLLLSDNETNFGVGPILTSKVDFLGKNDYNTSLLDFFENKDRWSTRQILNYESQKTIINFDIKDKNLFSIGSLSFSQNEIFKNLNYLSIRAANYGEVDDAFNYFWNNQYFFYKNNYKFESFLSYFKIINIFRSFYITILSITLPAMGMVERLLTTFILYYRSSSEFLWIFYEYLKILENYKKENTALYGKLTKFEKDEFFEMEEHMFINNTSMGSYGRKKVQAKFTGISNTDKFSTKTDILSSENTYGINNLDIGGGNFLDSLADINYNFKTYFIVLDDGLDYYFDQFKINTKIGDLLSNSIKEKSTYSDFSNSKQIHNYWEYFSNSKNYQEVVNSLNYQYYDNNYRISKFSSDLLNISPANLSTLGSQTLKTKRILQEKPEYSNIGKCSIDADNYIKFYLNTEKKDNIFGIKYLDSILDKYSKKILSGKGNSKFKKYSHNNVLGYNKKFRVSNYSNMPILRSFDNRKNIILEENLNNQDDYENSIFGNYSNNFEYFEYFEPTFGIYDEKLSFLIKNITENKKQINTDTDESLDISDFSNNINLITKDLVGRTRHKNKLFGNDILFKNQILGDQINSFLGSFWLQIKNNKQLHEKKSQTTEYGLSVLGSHDDKITHSWKMYINHKKSTKNKDYRLFLENYDNNVPDNFILGRLKFINSENVVGMLKSPTTKQNNKNNSTLIKKLNYFIKNSNNLLFNYMNKKKLKNYNYWDISALESLFFRKKNTDADYRYNFNDMSHGDVNMSDIFYPKNLKFFKKEPVNYTDFSFLIDDFILENTDIVNLWSDLDHENVESINNLPGFSDNVFEDQKFKKTNKRSSAGQLVIVKEMLKNIAREEFDVGGAGFLDNLDGFDKKLTLLDMDIKKKKLNTFLGNSKNLYKEFGGHKDYSFFKLWNTILRKINVNVWAPDLIPNYRKRQLHLGFNYIPEHLVYNDYGSLNKDTHMDNRLHRYFFKNNDTGKVFDMSYPITGQLISSRLGLVDKHVWGYQTNRISKLTKDSETSVEKNTNYTSNRFDNEIYGNLDFSFDRVSPLYLTNRTSNLMSNLNSYVGNSQIRFSDVINQNSPNLYKLFGYNSIRNMGILGKLDSRFSMPKDDSNNSDILKVSLFLEKKKKSNGKITYKF